MTIVVYNEDYSPQPIEKDILQPIIYKSETPGTPETE